MISVNLAAVFTVAALLAAAAAAFSTARASPQQAWSGGGGSGTGDRGGATCTNCTICPYSCRVPPQAPPPPPPSPQLPEFGGYAPPSAGPGAGVGETPSVGGNCPPGTTPMCCPQQQNPNIPNPYNPNPNNPNPNFSYYYSPPYSYAPFNGNELRRPFSGVLDGLAGFLQLFFVVVLIVD